MMSLFLVPDKMYFMHVRCSFEAGLHVSLTTESLIRIKALLVGHPVVTATGG